MENLLYGFLMKYPYLEVYILSLIYFLILYFVVGYLFEQACLGLERLKLAEKINPGSRPPGQKRREIIHSMVSIAVFGCSSWPFIYFYRNGFFTWIDNSLWNVMFGLLLLNLWNEIHFFLIHRLMHLPFFMRHVHRIHHLSRLPSVWSVYSFHAFEAFLLSTVPFTLSLFLPLAPLAIALYPLNSILFNFAGHCNYRIIAFKNTWLGMASRHIQHHQKVTVSFGFVSALLDKLFHKSTKTKQV